MTTAWIIGNLSSLLGMTTDSLSSTMKTTKGMLWVQNLSQIIYGVGAFLLGGYSGAVQNAVSLLRNLFVIANLTHPIIEWSVVGLGVALGVAFNNLGFMGLLPVIANFQYALVMFHMKGNERALKVSLLINVTMYIGFNAALYNIMGVLTNLIISITTAIVLIKTRKQKI